MNLFDGIPPQAGQFRDILHGHHPAKINDKAFQRSGVMLFRVREGQVGLPDASAIVAVEPWDIDHQFDLATPDRKHLENPWFLTELDDSTRPATRTLQGVRMNITIEERLVQKTTFLYCTPSIPNV
jgi:hypothetical protein